MTIIKYIKGFENIQDIADQYEIDISVMEEYDEIWALYDYGRGISYIILTKGDSYYIENSSHCSCYGLERQWEPVKTEIEALRMEKDSLVKEKNKSEYFYDQTTLNILNNFFDCIR